MSKEFFCKDSNTAGALWAVMMTTMRVSFVNPLRVSTMSQLPFYNPVPVSALVVNVEIGLGTYGPAVVLENQHGRRVGITHQLQLQGLDAVIDVHAITN